jgi:uncharacterized membrane protein
MKFQLKSFVSLFIAFVVIMLACKHDLPDVPPTGLPTSPTDTTTGWRCSADTVYYTLDIQPILTANCAMSGCHDAITRADGVNLSNYTRTMSTGGVVAGNPSSSDLYSEIVRGKMPPRGYPALTQAQKDLIAKWINQGAKNLACNANISTGNCDTTAVKYSVQITSILQNKCNGCHSNASTGGGILLTNYTQVKATVDNGKFWGAVAKLQGYSPMPQGGSLTNCELNSVQAWIRKGALNN